MSPINTLDLAEVRRLLALAAQKAAELDGMTLPDEDSGTKDRNRLIAALSKDLLFLGHVCEKAKVLVLDEYQVSRGFHVHLEGQALDEEGQP